MSPPPPPDPLRHWTAWPIRRPRITLLLIGVILLLCAGSISRMRPDGSLARMFSRSDPSAQAMLRLLDHFSAVEELLVLVSLPEAPSSGRDDAGASGQDRLLAFAQRLDQAIAGDADASRLTAGVLYRVDAQTRAFFEKVLVPHALYYLDDARFAAARERLTRPSMAEQIRRNEAMIASPGPAAQALAKAFLQDPLRLHEFIAPHLATARPFPSHPGSDAFLSLDGRALLVRIRGTRPPGDVAFSTRITQTVSRLADRVNTDGLNLQFTGAYAIADTSAAAIRADMMVNVTSTVILIQVLFLLAYRRPFRSFVLAFAPVIVGVIGGLGCYVFLTTAVTPLTAVIGGILAGMGIDYVRLEADRKELTAGVGSVPEGARLLPLLFEHKGASVNTRNVLHQWGYYVIERKTAAPLLFAHSRSFPVSYREPPPVLFNHLVLEPFAYEARTPAATCGAVSRFDDCDVLFRTTWQKFFADATERYDHLLLWAPTPEVIALIPDDYERTFTRGRLMIYAHRDVAPGH